MEVIREITITIEVDTNKATYQRKFDSFEELEEWFEAYKTADIQSTADLLEWI